VISPLCIELRSGGYVPSPNFANVRHHSGRLRTPPDTTIAASRCGPLPIASAMTAFAHQHRRPAITISPPNCVCHGNSPHGPAARARLRPLRADPLCFLLETGTLNTNFGSNVRDSPRHRGVSRRGHSRGMSNYDASDCVVLATSGSA